MTDAEIKREIETQVRQSEKRIKAYIDKRTKK